MQRINSVGHPLRAFWANPQQRMMVTRLLAGLALLVLGFGVYTAVDGQREYTDWSDKITAMVKRRDEFIQKFPTAEVDGEMKPDLSAATQSDLMFVAMLRRDEERAEAERIDADNQRRLGIRFIGIGVIGLALAYLVLPDTKSRSSSAESTIAPETSDGSTTR